MNTGSDSEVLLNVLASELQRVGTPRVTPADIFAAANAVYRRCRGGYAVVAMVIGHGILGFRDPNGIRPLVIGKRDTKKGTEWMLASESVALDMLGFDMVRDVAPGEAVFIDEQGRFYAQQCVAMARHTPCIFEYVYFARPDSIIDNISVYKARLRMGERLAEKIKRERPDHDIDVVIPIPDTSRTSAVQVAQLLGVKYREGFIKNRYIGRTFIMPGQEQRAKSVRSKLNAIDLEFRGKNVLLVDDSIVRGTTSAQIIDMAREAGAKKVYFASAAPPVRYPNVYGIDMPDASELVAAGHTDEEVRDIIGADWLIYQDLEDLEHAVRHDNAKIENFDTSCFSGEYVTGDVTPEYLARLQGERSDEAKQQRREGAGRGLKSVRSCRSRAGSSGAGLAAQTMRLLVIAARADYRLLVSKHVEIRMAGRRHRRASLGRGSGSRRAISPRPVSMPSIIVGAPPTDGRGDRWPPACWRNPSSHPSCCCCCRMRRISAARRRAACTAFTAARSTAIGSSRRSSPLPANTCKALALLRANPDYEQRYRFGTVIIRGHRCIRQVGSGGMCKIYLAESERAGTLVVLKVFNQVPDVSERFVSFDRFLQEYEIVAGLKHQNIVRILRSRRRRRSCLYRHGTFSRPAICASA